MNLISFFSQYIIALFIYNANLNDNTSHIGGSWIRFAKNIEYQNQLLCADLRTSKINIYDSNNVRYKMYTYKKSCVVINSSVQLINDDGNFKIYDTNQINNKTYSQKLTFPKVNSCTKIDDQYEWYYYADTVSFFPNSICFMTEFHINHRKINEPTVHRIEECVEYENDDCLYYQGGRFFVDN